MYSTQADLEARLGPEKLAMLVLDSNVPVESANPPALALLGSPGALSNGAYLYRVTFVYGTIEGTGTGPSLQVVVADNTTAGQVRLSQIPLSKKGTDRRIYRTQAGKTDFFFVAALGDNTTVTYDDNLADANLGLPPPVSVAAAGMIARADGMINAYIQDIVTLPLVVSIPQILRNISTDLACYYAMQRRFSEMQMPPDWGQVYKTAMDTLVKLSTEEITLDVAQPSSAPQAVMVAPDRTDSRLNIDFTDPTSQFSRY